MTDNRTTDITLEDVLNGIVGEHYPQGDTEMDNVSACNLDKLLAIAVWAADELACGGRLDDYLKSPYASMKHVANLHDAAIMGILEAFEPQVKRYYETWLAGDDDE